jgi:hypothetical protein
VRVRVAVLVIGAVLSVVNSDQARKRDTGYTLFGVTNGRIASDGVRLASWRWQTQADGDGTRRMSRKSHSDGLQTG